MSAKKTCVALDVEEGTSAAILTSDSGRDMSKGDCNPSFKVLITVQINERKIIFLGHISTDSSHGGSAASSNLGSADKIKELVKSFMNCIQEG